jgi:hypothetical protein
MLGKLKFKLTQLSNKIDQQVVGMLQKCYHYKHLCYNKYIFQSKLSTNHNEKKHHIYKYVYWATTRVNKYVIFNISRTK